MKIWVDDIRTPPDRWHWWKSSEEAIFFLSEWKNLNDEGMIGPPEVMSLDHDLGGDDTSRRIVLWCCENEFWPVEVRVHSQNPIGVEWLEGMINRYHPNGKDYRP